MLLSLSSGFFLLIVFLAYSNCQKTHSFKWLRPQIDNDDDYNGNFEYYPHIDEVRFSSIVNRLRLRLNIVEFMKIHFNVEHLELIYPNSISDLERRGECLLATRMIASGADEEKILVKIQRDEAVRAWMSESSLTSGKRTYCSRQLSAMRNCYEKLTSMEFYAAKLIETYKARGFFKFYSDYSLPLNFVAATSSIIGISPISRMDYYNRNAQILTYMNHAHTQDLKSWYMTHRTDSKLDRKLKRIFRQMHSAIAFLLTHDLVYTDFKPENILVNLNNKKGSAFLTHLDSVVFANEGKLENICHITIEYFPPIYGAQSTANSQALTTTKLIESFLKFETGNHVDRLLTWQFCLSLYSLVCAETFEKKFTNFSDRSVFNTWKNDEISLASHLNCSKNKIWNGLESFFEGCLYRKTRNSKQKKSFHRLIDHEWFESTQIGDSFD